MSKENLTKLWTWLPLGLLRLCHWEPDFDQGWVDVFGAKLFVDIQKFRRARAAASPSHKDEAQTATRR